MDLTNPYHLMALVIAILLVFGTVLVVIVKAFTIRALHKIEGAVTYDELKTAMIDVVHNDAMKLALMILERELRAEISKSRHDIRNELNAIVLNVTAKLDDHAKVLAQTNMSLARIEEHLKVKTPTS